LELLREMNRLQSERGFLDDATLRELAVRRNVPLYRLEGLVSFYSHFRRTPPPEVRVDVCRDIACCMAGCQQLKDDLQSEFADSARVEVNEVSCLGRCDTPPAVAVNDVPMSGEQGLAAVRALLDSSEERSAQRSAAPLQPNRFKCDPYTDPVERYGTVKSLIAAESSLGDECIRVLSESELRGMGGAGFPTGKKWELVAGEPAQPKYVICNADESEPGTFKDRVILERLPHLVIEGMLLAGLTVGARRGIVFIRHEYERERQAVERAIALATDAGILGENAAGSGQAFEIEVFVSPGGYILGEETALLEALEDKRGEPRNKPPYPGTTGLWGQPTLINNVETFALATSIIHHGCGWWESQGAGAFSGLKFVSVSGDVERPGVYEIPIGTSVRELIELAGGMRAARLLKAFLPGGASSKFLRAESADTPLEFDAMSKAGSMLGTGAVIVIGEGRDLFALANNLVRFFRNESCGKCVPCRVGTEKAARLLEQVQTGGVPASELDVLPVLGETLEQTSICGLGQVALEPVLSMMQQFPDDIPR